MARQGTAAATVAMAAAVACALAGCAPLGPASSGAALPRYRCEQDIAFTVRFDGDSAVLDAGARGNDLLFRDAGGLTAQQTVYSNPRMRAEFGLGASGRDAVLRYPLLPLVVRCIRD